VSSDEFVLHQMAHAIADAIARREVGIISGLLAPGFTYHGDGGATTSDAEAFLEGIRGIPGDIGFVRVERVTVDVAGDAAMVTGAQHAQVVVEGEAIDDRRAFADFFVRIDGSWKLKAGADFPAPANAPR
jgi:hypothetical protein